MVPCTSLYPLSTSAKQHAKRFDAILLLNTHLIHFTFRSHSFSCESEMKIFALVFKLQLLWFVHKQRITEEFNSFIHSFVSLLDKKNYYICVDRTMILKENIFEVFLRRANGRENNWATNSKSFSLYSALESMRNFFHPSDPLTYTLNPSGGLWGGGNGKSFANFYCQD